MDAKSLFTGEDEDFIIRIRREIHEYPEIGFELPRTVAVVERELKAMGIAFTERYSEGSVVAELGCRSSECFTKDFTGKTVALRADMDALMIEEASDVPYRSKAPGKMHACGHDTHTAMLLGAARLLKRAEDKLPCRVRLIFQPSEECGISGACRMCEQHVAEGVDLIAALHADPDIDTGKVAISAGNQYAACHPYKIEFFGKSSHATLPHRGADALAMAVKAYNDIYLMRCREISPLEPVVLSVSTLHAGSAHNIIADYAVMQISFRFYGMALHDFVDGRIRKICENAADELGGSCKFTDAISSHVVSNDAAAAALMRGAASKVAGEENVIDSPARLGSEDFSHYLKYCRGAYAHLGVRNERCGCVFPLHNANFKADEKALKVGSQVLAQFVFDQA